MKKIVYLLVWAGMFVMTACNDMEVGFLVADTAAYQRDSLSLYNMQKRLQELTTLQNQFYEQAGPLMEERDYWKEQAQEKRYELWDFDDYEIAPVEEALEATTDPDQRAELQELLDELYEKREIIRKEWQDLQNKSTDLDRKIRQIAIDMGIGSERELNNKISKLKNTMEYKIPWVTPPMESVFGTEPLIYSIVEVKNENPANAELFRKSLTIIGGGRMYVDQNVQAPPGRYVVSVMIKNEGYSKVLKDVFTFIIEEGDEIDD